MSPPVSPVSIRPRLWGRGKRIMARRLAAALGFNPPPALGPGETLCPTRLGHPHAVSIRPRLWGRGKPRCGLLLEQPRIFSIRPRLWGRGKRPPRYLASSTVPFQSAPGFGAGGNARLNGDPKGQSCFNPPPALEPGETVHNGQARPTHGVSIRPRLWGRGKPQKPVTSREVSMFQSAPGFGAGGNHERPRDDRRRYGFNPPPALGPGETRL